MSEAQFKILYSLSIARGGWLPIERIHDVLFGARETPLTGVQRASLSRSLRRLANQGLITRPDWRRAWWITEKGRLTIVRNGTQTLTG
jgi:hypothetical protein